MAAALAGRPSVRACRPLCIALLRSLAAASLAARARGRSNKQQATHCLAMAGWLGWRLARRYARTRAGPAPGRAYQAQLASCPGSLGRAVRRVACALLVARTCLAGRLPASYASVRQPEAQAGSGAAHGRAGLSQLLDCLLAVCATAAAGRAERSAGEDSALQVWLQLRTLAA